MKTIKEILNNRAKELTGRVMNLDDINSLIQGLKVFDCTDILRMMSEYPLAGCHFSTVEDNDDDDAAVGIDLQWMNLSQILSESLECYPGKSALKFGYIPIGMCSMGSGDYYYLKIEAETKEDPPLVRIFHDELDINYELTNNAVVIITNQLSLFLESAEIY
jgi:hypothetical protein